MDQDNSDDFTTAQQVEQWVRDNLPAVADHLDRDSGLANPASPYFPPSDAWTGYKRGRLVRLDIAKYAIHLAAARIFFRPLAHVIEVRIEKAKESIGVMAAEAGSLVFLKGFLGFAFRITLDLIEIWKTETLQRELEQSIRLNIARVQRDLNGDGLKQVSKKKRTKTVHSRHQTPRQRAANKK